MRMIMKFIGTLACDILRLLHKNFKLEMIELWLK
jgi:hypothetical protein